MKRLKLYWNFWKYGFVTAFWISLLAYIISLLVVVVIFIVFGLIGALTDLSITQTQHRIIFAVSFIIIGLPLFGWFLSRYLITPFYKRCPTKEDKNKKQDITKAST